MDILDYFQYFLKTETPFMLMFGALFLYFLKTSRDREKAQEENLVERIVKIQENQEVIVNVWKILLEKELEERKK